MLGLSALLGVVIIWVGSSTLMQFIFENESFSKPFFLTYLNTSCFMVYLFGFLVNPSWRSCSADNNKFSIREHIKLSGQFGIFWFLANYTFNLSLTMTSVSSNTIINSLSGLFTLIIGSVFGADSFTTFKLFGVALSFGGVVLVYINDSEDGLGELPRSTAGDLLSLISAFLYGCYIVLLKVKIPDENRVHMPMFFGFLGLLNFVFLLPLFFFLNWTGIEVWVLPDHKTLEFLFLNAFVGTVLSDYLWLWSVLLTSPLVATVGLSLTIPLAMLSDVLMGKVSKYTISYIFGCLLVLTGFMLLNVPSDAASRWFPLCAKLDGACRSFLPARWRPGVGAQNLPSPDLSHEPLTSPAEDTEEELAEHESNRAKLQKQKTSW